MVSKHSKLMKRQVQDRYERFTSPLSRTVPPSRQEVGNSSRYTTAPPPLRMREVGSSSHGDVGGDSSSPGMSCGSSSSNTPRGGFVIR
jgi:hypothetical protein